MKRVVSVSLGSPTRDHAVSLTLLGEQVQLERRGVNGDMRQALSLYRELDGVVDAFGIGGIEFYMPVADRRYYWRDARRIRQAIRVSKAGDGNGVRAILARRAVSALERRLNSEGRTLQGMKALKTTAVARYFLAQELVRHGCEVTCGDLMFGLGVPIPLRSLGSVRMVASVLLPSVTQLPYHWLYSLGEEQTAPPQDKWGHYYAESDLIAGDFLQIRSCMPRDLRGKIIVTNTTTKKDVEELRERGVNLLVTETPRFAGRTFGTNVIEALLLALVDKPQDQISEEDFDDLIERFPLEPSIEVLNPC